MHFRLWRQGLLTKKYLHGIPEHSRAARSTGFLKVDQVTEDKVGKARRLDEIAARRGQTLAEMALAWGLERRTNDFCYCGDKFCETVGR